MGLTCLRTQHPVGQGSFKSSIVIGDKVLRYVYDCGAMASYSKSLDAAIKEYHANHPDHADLDVLFISHAHADHLNGIERLLASTRKIAVDTIMMPLLTVEERLLAYSRTAMHDVPSAASAFYQEFIVNPTAALGSFKPRRIIYVRRGDQGGAPFSGGPDDVVDPDGMQHRKLIDGEQPKWKLVGRGAVERVPSLGAQAGTDVLSMDDTLGIVTRTGPASEWLLAPYVDPTVKTGVTKFVKQLALELGVKVAKLKSSLLDTTYVRDLIINHAKALKTAYSSVATDLNITSMCLYAGPARDTKHIGAQYHCEVGNAMMNGIDVPRVAWLGTGDAALAHGARRRAFFAHFGKLVDAVQTFVLPHHGSEENFHKELMAKITPTLCVASADKYKEWRHPGTAVVQAVASSGRFVSVVTASPASMIMELVMIP